MRPVSLWQPPPLLRERLGEEASQELTQWLASIWEEQTQRALRRLEDGQDRLEAALAALAEAQRRTEERLERLEATVQQLAEAQRGVEERMARLEEAQIRTEKRLEQLAEAQRGMEERLARLEEAQIRTEERLEQLAEAQRGMEERLARLEEAQIRTEERLARLEEAQIRTEERLERLEATVQQLAEAQCRTEERLANLIKVVEGIQDTVGALKGRQLEITYRERAGAYFGPLLRRLRVLAPHEIEDDLEANLSAEEFRDLLQLDLLVSGWPRHLPAVPQVWLAVEVSGVIDRNDVRRAIRRAGYLRKAGYKALPAVAGEQATRGAEEIAEDEGVLLVLDGWARFWEQALGQVLTEAKA